ncbi:MAG TPA: hypothetical protein VJU59_02310 [Paraburkholderia sp.]|uniref:hypothetical protein n=1 Tax=Paraburkholderia sp. TaxID=1926495 RepID=UPI002B4856F5|nr:hypothetical protein [Paraburkholderia sp.]HKR38505.1 hypothetical protein [Paraburkholderia sp.]
MNFRQIAFVVGAGVLTTSMLVCQGDYAQASSSSDTRIGCIHVDASGARFIAAGRSRAQIVAETQAAAASGGNAGDPCLTGRVANVPASVYAALAQKYPATYAPLPGASPGATTSSVAAVPDTSTAAQAGFNLTYVFTDLDALVPPGFSSFVPVGVAADGRVFGTVYDTNYNPYVAVYENGSIKVLAAGYPYAVSQSGIVGGAVVTDPVNGYTQSAIFRGNSVELIPRGPGELASEVFAINDAGTAVISVVDVNFNFYFNTYSKGNLRRLVLANNFPVVTVTGINNAGVLVGFAYAPDNETGFSYDFNRGTTTLLLPVPAEPYSWAMGINDEGDIVGYSWGNVERVGIWPHNGGGFVQYFAEGTPQYPTVSYNLLINARGLIVITATSDGQSYLVPAVGVRLPLVNRINYDAGTLGSPSYVTGINNADALVGFTSTSIDFLLTPQRGKQ